MESTDLFYPEIRVSIGSYRFTEGVEIEVHSSAATCFDWAEVCFTREYQLELSMEFRALATIELGYNGGMETVFTGRVDKTYNSGGMDKILLKDDMLLLEETRITGAFLNTTPQEMIEYGLAQAGVRSFKLSDFAYPERSRVVIRDMSVRKLIPEIHGVWGTQQPYFFQNGVFYWGDKPEQEKVYLFEYGVNLLSLIKAGGAWELTTVSAPFVRHSQNIEVRHPRLQGVFQVIGITFHTNDAGFIRTTIQF